MKGKNMKKLFILLMIPFLFINFVDAGKGKKKNITEKITAYELSSGKPPPVEEMRKKLMMVHITDVLPEDGTMVPGAIYFKTKEYSLKEDFQLSKDLPRTRMTLHWCAGGAVEDHNSGGNKRMWSKKRYAIIEPFRNLENEFVDGYVEDFFIAGPHKLSDDAIILVPQTESKEILKQYPKLKKHFIAYSSEKMNSAQAANSYIKNKGFWSIKVPQNQDVICKQMKMSVDGNQFLTGTFFKNLIEEKKLEFCVYNEHLLGKFEKELVQKFLKNIFLKIQDRKFQYCLKDNDKLYENCMLLTVKSLIDYTKEDLKIKNFIKDKSYEQYGLNFLSENALWINQIVIKEFNLLKEKKSLFNILNLDQPFEDLSKKYGENWYVIGNSVEEIDSKIIKGDEETLNELIKECHKQIEEQGLRKVTFEEEKKEEEKVFN
jgi:hypothetical protein